MIKNARFSFITGFTLIELLVVIAIIGLLATISYGYLDQARSNGIDAGAKSDLLSMRPEMELLYVESGSETYDGQCDNSDILKFNTAIQDKIGSGITCNTSVDKWAVEIELLSGDYFCIDSEGRSVEDSVSKETRVAEDAVTCE